jgi:hypothetical protein
MNNPNPQSTIESAINTPIRNPQWRESAMRNPQSAIRQRR